jgi:hypothetical protein
MTYGFSYEDARRLLRVARRDSFRSPGAIGQSSLEFDDKEGFERGIPFRNDSAETAPAYAVMRITNSSALTATSPFFLTIAKPDSTLYGLYLINGPDEVANNGFGRGHFHLQEGEWNYARYFTGGSAPSTGESWGVTDGQWYLRQHGPGFLILGGPLAGNGFVNVLQYTLPHVLGKTDASVLGGNTVTVSVWGGASGSEADSGLNISSCRLRYGYVPSTTFVTVDFINGLPYIGGDHRTVRGKADSTITDGSTGTFSIWNGTSDTTDNITVKAEGHDLESGLWATAWQEEKSGTWYGALRECPS